MAIPSLARRPTDMIGVGTSGVGFGSVATWLFDKASICQNLSVWSYDVEMRMRLEEKAREVIL